MKRKTSQPAAMGRTRMRGANDSVVWNRTKFPFVSICPTCGHDRLQHGYTHRTLSVLLTTRRKIDAFCIVCNVCWPISESERQAISPP
jgi:ribosomal protein L32